MIIGDVNELEVKRVSDIAYVLTDGENEIFMHKKEAVREHEVNDKVKVFIYQDSKKRLAASENKPLITINRPSFLKVVGIKEDTGFFLHDGMPKDLQLAFDDCIFEEDEKPQIGDYLFVYLKANEHTFRARLVARQAYNEYLIPQKDIDNKEFVKAYVTSRTKEGVYAYTFEGHEIFVPKGNDRMSHRIGEELTVQVIENKGNFKYTGTLLKKKTLQLDEDARKVFNYLKTNKNDILSEKDSPIEIYQKFQMSKSSFKRAVGILYKERFIDIVNDIIKLKVE